MIKSSFIVRLAFLFAPICASAAITVTFHTESLDSGFTLIDGEIYLESVEPSPDYSSASIRNALHHDFFDECAGISEIGFVRHRYNEADCAYFFRAADIGTNDPSSGEYFAVENWGRVYWMAGDQLVDGAMWGSDNYVLMRDLSRDKIIAVLQFDFDQTTGLATLLASAIDQDGLTYSQGVMAINGLTIPEPSSFAIFAAAAALGFGATTRRRRA